MIDIRHKAPMSTTCRLSAVTGGLGSRCPSSFYSCHTEALGDSMPYPPRHLPVPRGTKDTPLPSPHTLPFSVILSCFSPISEGVWVIVQLVLPREFCFFFHRGHEGSNHVCVCFSFFSFLHCMGKAFSCRGFLFHYSFAAFLEGCGEGGRGDRLV